MRNSLLTALPFLLLFSVSAHSEMFKCTVDGKVEYRDVPCPANAEQQVMDISNEFTGGATPADAAAVAAQLRQADQALSERLAHEHELRMQIAAQQALADQQERIASERMAAAELQYSDNAVPVIGTYLPFGSFRHSMGGHFGRRGHLMGGPAHQFHHHGDRRDSFAAHRQSPGRTGSFAANINF